MELFIQFACLKIELRGKKKKQVHLILLTAKIIDTERTVLPKITLAKPDVFHLVFETLSGS